MQNTVINGDALRRTLVLMVGAEAAQVIDKTYQAINEAQAVAYEVGFNRGQTVGHSQGFQMGQENAEARISAAFDNGWMFGQAEAEDATETDVEVAADMSYDEGYLNGVDDARRRPEFADANVHGIINEATGYAINGEVEVLDEDFDAEDEYCYLCDGRCELLAGDIEG